MVFESNAVIDFDNGGHLDREAWFNNIIEMCDDMDAYDRLKVYDFGENRDLLLDIQKDPDFDRDVDPDKWNIVRIFTAQYNEAEDMLRDVDDTEDTYVTDGSLYTELDRIWNYIDFGTI